MSAPKELSIRNWEKWQSYRSDRGQPPWIKLHRSLMRNVEWVTLNDAQRGQLVAMWLLAADQNGTIPASPAVLRKLCHMDSEPDLQLFESLGFIETRRQRDANLTPSRRQHDRPETEEETEKEEEEDQESKSHSVNSGAEPTGTATGNGSTKPDPLKPYPILASLYPHLWDAIKKNFPHVIVPKRNSSEEWESRDTLAKLVRLDKYTEAQVRDVLRWVLFQEEPGNDGFTWRQQFHSIVALRRRKKGDGLRKFDKMAVASKKAGAHNHDEGADEWANSLQLG